MTVSIAKLTADARRRAFGIDDMPWQLGVDPSKLWAPERMSHLYHCDSYHDLLNDEERLYYNQVFAAGICEQFIFLEEWLLVRGLRSLLDDPRRTIDPELREAMEIFVVEEIKHGEMFFRLLKMSFPELYGKERWVVFKRSRFEMALLELSMGKPDVFLWWIWVAIFFEEKTLDFYRKYGQADRNHRFLDPLYREVHRYHAMDEARHFQMDTHFLAAFWDPAPEWKKTMNLWIVSKLLKSFANPRHSVTHAIARLVERFPRLVPHRARLLGEIRSVSERDSWQAETYSRKTLPRTFALFDRYPAVSRKMAEIFPHYRPGEAVTRQLRPGGVAV